MRQGSFRTTFRILPEIPILRFKALSLSLYFLHGLRSKISGLMKPASMPRDGGGFILSDEERERLIKEEPLAQKWIRPYIGAYEFINRKTRWCLWLVGANPREIRECPTA